MTSKADFTNSNLKDALLRVSLIATTEESFKREMKALRQGPPIPLDSDLRKVNAYIDPADGILKVNGRLEYAPLAESARHPLIISPDHHFASLSTNQAHVDAHHAGVEHTHTTIRTKYYLLRGRRAVRKVIARCANNFILGCHHPHLPPNIKNAFHGASRKHWEQAQFI